MQGRIRAGSSRHGVGIILVYSREPALLHPLLASTAGKVVSPAGRVGRGLVAIKRIVEIEVEVMT